MTSAETGAAPGARAHHRLIIIGAGAGGICAGIKLREAGIEDFLILEKASAPGGTWWYNRYPGAACDVPSHLYSFSFAVKRDWSGPYAGAREILDYLVACAERGGVLPHIRCDSAVRAARWDDTHARWAVDTTDGGYTCDVLVAAQGMFNEPAWPDLPGLANFAGACFHTARWDHAVPLAGRRVGVIGSAASAVQCVPEVAKVAGALTMFQRTPNWVLPKNDKPYTPEKLDYFRFAPDAVEQNRARLYPEFAGFALFEDPVRNRDTIAAAHANLALVEDPATRARLTPDYAFGCKRVLLSSDFYPAFNRPHVSVVTEAVREVTQDGVITAEGAEHGLDVLVFATGFHVSRYLSSIEVTGRGGLRLADAWRDGAQAYLGITTAGFPNLFQLYGPNTNKGSILFVIECQVAYLLRQLARMAREDLAWLDVRPEVMARYNADIQRDCDAIRVWSALCNNYYRHAGSGRMVTQYPRHLSDYRRDTARDDADAYLVGERAASAAAAR
jgi:cation diffusion facilitator CzcD-associated flavoprotein CzcO